MSITGHAYKQHVYSNYTRCIRKNTQSMIIYEFEKKYIALHARGWYIPGTRVHVIVAILW